MWRSAVGSGKELEMRRHSMCGFMNLAEKAIGHVWGVSWIVDFDEVQQTWPSGDKVEDCSSHLEHD